jgi:hypothetical protein
MGFVDVESAANIEFDANKKTIAIPANDEAFFITLKILFYGMNFGIFV